MSNNFKIVISATDNATETIRKINESFAKMSRPMVKLQRSAGALDKELGLEKIGKSLRRVTRSTQDVVSGLSKIAAPIAAIAGIGSIASVAALATEWGHLGLEVTNTAAGIGVATSTLLSLRGAARIAGVSAETLTGSLKSVGDTMEDALYGRNQSALMLLNKLGIGIHKTADGSIDAVRGFKELATAISKVKSAQVQGLIARQFGLEAALPLIRKGAKGIEEYQRKVQEFGGVRTQAAIAAAADFGLKLNYLSVATQGLKNSIGETLIPILMPFVEKLAKWVAANRELIATKVAQFIKGFAEWLDKINFDDVLKGCTKFIKSISDVVEGLGGWKTVALGLGAVMTLNLLAPVAQLGLALTALTVETIPKAIKALIALSSASAAGGGAAAGAAGAGTAAAAGGGVAGAAAGGGILAWLGGSALAGALGYGLGMLLSDGMDKALQWATGDKYTTLGGEIYDRMHPNQINLGNSGRSSGGRIGGLIPKGIRSNNPLNLQPGGKEAVFSSPEEGITAGVRNILRNYQGLTLAQYVHKYAPGNGPGNTPASEAAYLADLSSKTGVAPNQVPNLNDAKTLTPLVSAQIRHENGQNPYDKGTIDNAVQTVIVEFKNAPPGTHATARTESGRVVPTRVNHAMPTLAAG